MVIYKKKIDDVSIFIIDEEKLILYNIRNKCFYQEVFEHNESIFTDEYRNTLSTDSITHKQGGKTHFVEESLDLKDSIIAVFDEKTLRKAVNDNFYEEGQFRVYDFEKKCYNLQFHFDLEYFWNT